MTTKAVLRIRRDADAALAELGKRFTAAWKSRRSSAREDVDVLIEFELIEKTERGDIHVAHAVIEVGFALRAV